MLIIDLKVIIMRKGLLALTIVLIIVFGFLMGKYIYETLNVNDNSNTEIYKANRIANEATPKTGDEDDIKEVNAKEEKVSPNAKVITSIYYDECGHTVKTSKTIENQYINLTKEELSEELEDFEIQEFTPEEITLYKEEEGICNEHYILRDKDGYVAIYNLDTEENEILENVTEIGVQFLPLTDLEKIKGGLRVYGRENLNRLLEDFE